MKLTNTILVLLLVLIAGFYMATFYPGYMSYDSAYHYQQLESTEWTTFQPVIILLFWKVTNGIVEGPGGLFALFLILYLTALWLLSRYIEGGWQRKSLLLLLALQPVNIMIFPHIWKDIGLLVFTLLAIAFLVIFFTTQRRGALWASFASLWVAVLFRFEAILYLWPLVFFQVQQYRLAAAGNTSASAGKTRYQFRDALFVVLFAVIALFSNKALVELSNSKKVTLWPTIALWDLARVSVRENEQLLPPFTVGHNMTVADLAQATHNWTNTSLFSSTKAGVNNGLYTPYTKAQYRQLLKQWVLLPVSHPKSYFKHRLRLASDLIRIIESPNKPQDLFWTNKMIQYGDRFPANKTRLNQLTNDFLTHNKDSFYFKPWFYLLLAVTVLAYLVTAKPTTQQQRLAGHLIVSAFLSVAVLFFLAPAAEQRYLIILFNVVPIAACSAWPLKTARYE